MVLFWTYQDGYSFLKAKGENIVDESGQTVMLRGLGLGGWLVPEGYMLHIPGYGSPTSIRNMIVNLIGEENTAEFYRRYQANYVNEKDIAAIASWGFNSIRLPFNYRMLTPEDQPGVYLEEGFAVMDSLIRWCGKYDMYVILDMHCAPGGQNGGNISDSDGEAKLWTIVSNQDRTVDIWRRIAERYANEEGVAGYDLLNEPVLPTGVTNDDLRNFFKRITKAIREVDTNHMVIVEGNWYATDFSGFTWPILIDNYNNTPNVVYSFHKYWNSTAVNSISGYLLLRHNYSVPLWLGESGENSNPWFYEAINVMEENTISWCWWTHKKISTITSPYSAPITPDYQKILNYWNGSGSKPDVDFAKNALFEMAENLAIEKCEYHPDVVAALMDPEFGSVSKPYADHHLPGIMNASDYDIGTNGVAYSDNHYKQEDQSQAGGNEGYSYRNDGVDVESSRDNTLAPYSVGWIDTGEWLKYTVQVDTAGTYDVSLSVAATTSGGSLSLLLDGQVLQQGIAIPATGGWYNWKKVTSGGLYFPEGQHVLTVRIDQTGFNLNRLEFDLKVANGIEEPGKPAVASTFLLRQNYPNPFNGGTYIPFFLSSPGIVKCTIFDIDGAEVRILVKNAAGAGWDSFHWNGLSDKQTQLSSGIYFYRVSAGENSQTRRMIYMR